MSTLAEIFGEATNVSERLEKFDWSTIDVSNKKYSDYFTDKFAPFYGTLDSAGLVYKLDDQTKLTIAGAAKVLGSLSKEKKNYDDALKALQEYPGLQIEFEDDRSSQFLKDISYFTEADDVAVEDLFYWLSDVIGDELLVYALSTENIVADIFSQAQKVIESFQKDWEGSGSYEQPVIDLGVFQFPETEGPRSLQVYSFKLGIVYEKSKAGFNGEFNITTFEAPREFVEGLDAETLKASTTLTEKLFHSVAGEDN